MKAKFLLLLVGFFLILPDCGQQSPSSDKAKSLSFAVQSRFNGNFHPVEDSSIINFQPLLRSLFSTIFKLDANLKPYPFLIKEYKKRGKLVEFQLKEGIKFSDGSRITSEDVVWSIECGLKYPLDPNPIYRLIKGGVDFFQGKTSKCSGIKVISSSRFQIEFISENIEFPYYFTHTNLSIVPKNWTTDSRIFSGAYYLLKEVKEGDGATLTLKKNSNYLEKKAKLDTIYFCFYDTNEEFKSAIKKGEPDMFLYNFYYNIPDSDYPYNYFKTPIAGNFLFLLNPRKGVFRDKKLRHFFKSYLHSIDFSKMEKWSFATPAKLVLPYGLTGYFVFKEFPKTPLQNLIPREKKRIRCYYFNRGIRTIVFPILKKDLQKYNIELDLFQENWDQLTPRMRNGDFDLTAFYFKVDIPNSFHFYENLLTSSVDINPIAYQIPKATKLLNQYRSETSDLKRLKILAQLEAIAQDEAFVIPVLNSMCLLGYKQQLKNVKIDWFLNLPFEDIDIEKGN